MYQSMTTIIPLQGNGETSGAAAQAGSPLGQVEALPPHLLHQSSGTSAASASMEQQPGLRHINTRRRASSISAASPRQAPALPAYHFNICDLHPCRAFHCSAASGIWALNHTLLCFAFHKYGLPLMIFWGRKVLLHRFALAFDAQHAGEQYNTAAVQNTGCLHGDPCLVKDRKHVPVCRPVTCKAAVRQPSSAFSDSRAMVGPGQWDAAAGSDPQQSPPHCSHYHRACLQ